MKNILRKIRRTIIILVVIAALTSLNTIRESKNFELYRPGFDLDSELQAMLPCCSQELYVGNWGVLRASDEEMFSMYCESQSEDTEAFRQLYAKTGMAGLTDPDCRVIYIIEGDDYNAKRALPHEIGHAADINHECNGIKPSQTEEFKKIYEQEAEGYGQMSPEEFFAEVYATLVSPYDFDMPETPLADEYVGQFVY